MRKGFTLLTLLGSSVFTLSCGDVISPAPPPPTSLVISPSVAPSGTVGFAYNLTLTANGGQVPYTWSVIAGTLPLGLSLDASTGVLSGVPSVSGTSSFTVQAADSSVPARTGGMPFTIVVNPQLSFSITSLPDGAVSVAYNASASVSGGAPPYTWSIVSGSLPPGLSLNSATGAIIGTPTAAGSFGLGLKVTDSSSPQQTAKFFSGIVVYPTLIITPTSLPDGVVGSPYNTTLSASGGTGSYTWSVISGTLPDGISLDPTTGILAGTPVSEGQSNFTVQVTDTANPPQSPSLPLSLTVTAAGANNRLMKGTYAFLLQGFDTGGAVAIAGQIEADGAGAVTGGVFDISRSSGAQEKVPVDSGQFSINSDNRGFMTIRSAVGSQSFQIALNGTGALAHFIECDPAGARAIRGNGIMKRRVEGAVPQSVWSGSYAFSFSGSTYAGHRSAIVGSFTANAAGGIGSGLADINSNGAIVQEAAVQATSSYSFAPTGRGSLKLVVNGVGSILGATYSVSDGESFFVRTDSPSEDILSGEILRQSGSFLSTSVLAGTDVLHLEGDSLTGSTVVGVGIVDSASLFALSGTYDINDGGRIASLSVSDGRFDITSGVFGRGSLKFAGNDLVFYLIDSASAFVMDAAGAEVKTGMLERETVGDPSFAHLAGRFAEGSEADLRAGATFESGVAAIEPLGSLLRTTDENLAGNVLSTANATNGALSFIAPDRFRLADGTTYYVISPTRMIRAEMQIGKTNHSLVFADK